MPTPYIVHKDEDFPANAISTRLEFSQSALYLMVPQAGTMMLYSGVYSKAELVRYATLYSLNDAQLNDAQLNETHPVKRNLFTVMSTVVLAIVVLNTLSSSWFIAFSYRCFALCFITIIPLIVQLQKSFLHMGRNIFEFEFQK